MAAAGCNVRWIRALLRRDDGDRRSACCSGSTARDSGFAIRIVSIIVTVGSAAYGTYGILFLLAIVTAPLPFAGSHLGWLLRPFLLFCVTNQSCPLLPPPVCWLFSTRVNPIGPLFWAAPPFSGSRLSNYLLLVGPPGGVMTTGCMYPCVPFEYQLLVFELMLFFYVVQYKPGRCALTISQYGLAPLHFWCLQITLQLHLPVWVLGSCRITTSSGRITTTTGRTATPSGIGGSRFHFVVSEFPLPPKLYAGCMRVAIVLLRVTVVVNVASPPAPSVHKRVQLRPAWSEETELFQLRPVCHVFWCFVVTHWLWWRTPFSFSIDGKSCIRYIHTTANSYHRPFTIFFS